MAGFTLIELVLVIAVLGILAVTAMPTMFDISLTNARTNAMNATAGAVRTGLSLYAANQVAQGLAASYPNPLDAAADGSIASGAAPLFSAVLITGVTAQWIKVSATCYAFDMNGNNTLDAGTDTYFQYDSSTGTFNQIATCS
jgi:prepilin-type N-terminal cleavage/methylation domain-containing protein